MLYIFELQENDFGRYTITGDFVALENGLQSHKYIVYTYFNLKKIKFIIRYLNLIRYFITLFKKRLISYHFCIPCRYGRPKSFIAVQKSQ